MCGISGFYNLSELDAIDITALRRMTAAIRHRGTDDEGYCLINNAKRQMDQYSGKDSSTPVKMMFPHLPSRKNADLGMGFRRLAIIELSEKGHQPMLSADGSCVITYNGEIYNYVELRDELRSLGHEFASGSDTEVILAAWREWGEECVSRFIGMWAFALWDMQRQCLFCSRDRFGIKPFFYYWDNHRFLWCSEIKGILAAVQCNELDEMMLWRSIRINAMLVYGDATFWRGIKSLEAGHNLVVTEIGLSIRKYYALAIGGFERSDLSIEAATKKYRELFLDSLRLQMRSDVEVGSCLSGGLDSSAIVCSAAKLSPHPISTFSSYYPMDRQLDERVWINEVVSRVNVSSHLVSPTAHEAWDDLIRATWHNDLPLGMGCVSQYAVMRLAKQNGIKVLLDGQGCDEICAGYNHAYYRYFADLFRRGKIRELSSQAKRYFEGKKLHSILPAAVKTLMSSVMSERRLYAMEFRFYRFEALNRDFRDLALRKHESEEGILDEINVLPTGKLSNFLYNLLSVTSLGTLLHYEDRMSMAHSVESRVPYLDHRLVEFCFTLPSEYKLQPPFNKFIHRQAVRDIVPLSISNRVDKGVFGAPFLSKWLKDDLRRNVEDILYSSQFRQRGIWDLPAVMNAWRSFLIGDQSRGEMLFNIVSTEVWFREVFLPQPEVWIG